MKNRLLALLMATAMVAAMAPAALAEEIQAEVAGEAVAVEEIAAEAEAEATPAEEETPATEEAAPEEAVVAEEAVEAETVDAAAEEATGKTPESVIIGDEDIVLETADVPNALQLDYTSITIGVGENFDILAIAVPNTYENRNCALKYTTSDSRFFTVVGDADNTCTITGRKVTTSGEMLTVRSVDNPNAVAYCRVYVTEGGSGNRPITGVTLDKTSIDMASGDKYTVTATINPSNTTSSKALYWGSNNKNVVTVEGGLNNTGVITARGIGTAQIYVETTNGKYAYCTVVVKGSIKLNDTHMSLMAGGSQQLYATVEGNNKTVTWSCDNTDVATVDGNGVVRAVGAGRATVTAKSVDGMTATCTVSVTANQKAVTAFVIRLYDVCLNREPDAGGLVDWTNQLMDGSISGSQAAYGFIFSDEFKAKNFCNTCFTKQLYRAFMGREFDEPGLKDWVGKLNTGVTREAVFNGFAKSNEFRAICNAATIKLGDGINDPGYGRGTMPTGPCPSCGYDGVTPFVTRLYEVCLLRNPEPAGLKNWVSQLYSHAKTGRDVAAGFIFSVEFKNANYNNEDYVERLYQAFMGRKSDAAGKADWVGKLNAGYSREQVFEGFVGSTEFMNICGTYGILRG